ncbi:MAG: HEAT repeat domain-containing protein [Pseudomonadota bacterium]
MMAWTLIAAGDAEAGLRYVEAARRLDPRGPGSHALFAGAAHFALGELEKAAAVLEARLAEDPRAWELAPLAAAVQARLGRRAAAPETLRRWRPDLSDAGRRVALGRYLFPVRWIGEAAHLNADLQDAMRLAAEPASVTVESLLERLAEAGPDGQVDAIRRLGWFGPAAAPATGALSAALGAEDRRVSREAAVTLGKIGPAAAGAVPQLEAMADRPIIGFRAREALALIQGAPGD